MVSDGCERSRNPHAASYRLFIHTGVPKDSMFRAASRIIPALAVLIAAFFSVPFSLAKTSGADTVISNRAEATYQDESGESFRTASQTVTVTVVTVAAISVTPDETSPSNTVAPHEQVTRVFRVCNTGNNADSFTVTRFEVTTPVTLNALYFDNDASGTITDGDALIQLNETASPVLAAGACIGVLASIGSNDAPAQSTITLKLTARTNLANSVNGRSEDTGTIINTVGQGALFTDPANPSLPPSNLVDGLSQHTVVAGADFTYAIAFRNSGDSPGRNVLITDQLPEGIEYVATSLQLDGRNLSDAIDADEGSVQNNRIEVRLGRLDPGVKVNINFRARLSGRAVAGTGLVNKAAISSDNAPPIETSHATVITNPFGFVFAGHAGGSSPIPGAKVEVLQDQGGDNFLNLPPNIGFVPNEKNQNPFSSDALGRFTFALGPDQIGELSKPVNYFLRVSAERYVPRDLQLTVAPTHSGLFLLSIHALDNQPLAGAGGFDLVREDVSIKDLAALALNIPMFEPSGLQITKSADRARAEIGDTITYRIELHNPTSSDVSDVIVDDHLPASFDYAAGSALFGLTATDNQPIEPNNQNGGLQFRLGQLPHAATIHLLYRVRVGANARIGEQENVASASGLFPSGERVQTPSARASVFISAGAFSTQQVLVGRVFVDVNGNGKFDDGDRPAPGVRLYLNDGQSVITDSAGLYNFPSLGDGPQVISLDPVSVPSGYKLASGDRLSDKTWTRLLRTPVGGGALLRQNFVLIDKRKPATTSTNSATQNSPGHQFDKEPSDAVNALAQSLAATSQSAAAKNLPARPAPSQPGTYEVAATDNVQPVAPGDIRILSPAPNSVSMSPGLEIEAQVALNWNVKLEVNDDRISDKNIGVRSLDHKNRVSTFKFVGINLKPGPNKVRCTAISPDGAPGHSTEMLVMGRGPARRLEIFPERPEIQSGGNDFTMVRLKAFDQWNNPALDGEVGIETSLGELRRLNQPKEAATASTANLSTATGAVGSQVIVQLEGGEARLKLLSSAAPGEARLRAQAGQIEATSQVHVTSEIRPSILVGLAEMSFGNSIPEVTLRNESGKYRGRISLFYSGRLPMNTMLTMSYDSQRPINRTTGRDRLFQLDPLDRIYPLFGDSSTRYEAAQSNSKLYLRIDHKRSYAMFGDFETDADAPLAGYARKLTGAKAHLENTRGDFITVTGARPDTAFARDVFPAGSLSLMQLSNADVLPGSENVSIEVRDRRNPEIIVSRETLTRSIDYNLDTLTGRLLLLRHVSAFDSVLNLTQIVVTYEHRANSMSSGVYTARARKNFKGFGLKLGFSGSLQRQPDEADFLLGGIDIEKSLPHGGSLQLAWARSQGKLLGGGNVLGPSQSPQHDGDAYQLVLTEPLPFYSSVVRARYVNAEAGFLNPFGATVTPGSRRGEVSFEMKPLKNSTLHFAAIREQNKTANVDNGRTTFSAALDQILGDRVKLHFGFDHRAFTDDLNDKRTDSNLMTAGVEVQATNKLQFSIKREQNLSEADPTYPTQTTLGASYQFNSLTKLFYTQRLATAPIVPIGDFTGNGFAFSNSRRETAVGVETRFGKHTSLTSRYQIENGINGTDSFAVIGLQNSFPLTKKVSLDFGFERGFHLLGPDRSFNSASVGFGWQPNSDFKASGRYEYRDRQGVGQLLALGAAGKLKDGVTALSHFQFSRGSFSGRLSESLEGTVALALRPLNSDRSGLLFSYTHRSMNQSAGRSTSTRDRSDSLATDAYHQATKRLELYGRFVLRCSANGQPDQPYVSTLSFLTQARAQYRLTSRLDWAFESRALFQPSSHTMRNVYATEAGFWVLPDLRIGGGYNFTAAKEPAGSLILPSKRGFYFTISSKLSNLFDLFGTSKAGLESSSSDPKEPSHP